MPEAKCCRGCGQTKPDEEFKKNRLWCKPCYNQREAKRAEEWRAANPGMQSKRVLESRKKNPDAYREYHREWSRTDKAKETARAWVDGNREAVNMKNRLRKAMRRGMRTNVAKQRVLDLLRLQKNKCAACFTSLKGGYHIDHIMPIALGGDSSPENLQLLCPTCNCSKGPRHPVDFMQRIGRLL